MPAAPVHLPYAAASHDAPLPRLLLVDDNPAMVRLMARCLDGVGRLSFATHGAGALRLAAEQPPDLILLDAEMPGMSGFEVCERLKSDPALSQVPVIFVTGHSGPAHELKGLGVGAVDFIAKPISEPLLVARVRTHLRLKRLADDLRRLATVDELTGLVNRRAFEAALRQEWARARRLGEPISLLMVDVDHFKRYNDRYGHPAGDVCLAAVAGVLAAAGARPADVVARPGGEEFALLLPHTPAAGAERVAQRVVEAVAALGIAHAASDTASHVTVSVGTATTVPDDEALVDGPAGLAAFVKASDDALYEAKRSGRARACAAEPCRRPTDAAAC